jgi:hypothetical protein
LPSDERNSSSLHEEVREAVHRYYNEVNNAIFTGDTSTFRTLVSKECPCYKIIESVAELKAEGKKTQGGAGFVIDSVRPHDVHSNLAAAEIELHIEPYAIVDSTGKVVDRYPLQRQRIDISLVRHKELWVTVNSVRLDT